MGRESYRTQRNPQLRLGCRRDFEAEVSLNCIHLSAIELEMSETARRKFCPAERLCWPALLSTPIMGAKEEFLSSTSAVN